MELMGNLINSLSENEDGTKSRKNFNKMVKKLQVEKEIFARSMLNTLKSNLGKGYTPEVQEAWIKLF